MHIAPRLFTVAVIGSLGLMFAPDPAKAISVVTVNVGGTNYDVTSSELTYELDSSKFQAPPAGQMPWWGNSALAQAFATQVGTKLGLPLFTNKGPIFAFEYKPSPDLSESDNELKVWFYDSTATPNIIDGLFSTGTLFTATATLTPTPSAVPGPLPLFGAAAAFGMSRRLRRRIQLGG